MPRKTYSEMTPEQQEAHKQRVIESQKKNQKQIPLKYKKDIAEKIYCHAEKMGSSPITWIKDAIEKVYKEETGEDLKQ